VVVAVEPHLGVGIRIALGDDDAIVALHTVVVPVSVSITVATVSLATGTVVVQPIVVSLGPIPEDTIEGG
jgi:hypothetical protein